MTMESRSTEISREPEKWKVAHPEAILVTIKRGVKYYAMGEYDPFVAIASNRVYQTTFYGLDDVELFG